MFFSSFSTASHVLSRLIDVALLILCDLLLNSAVKKPSSQLKYLGDPSMSIMFRWTLTLLNAHNFYLLLDLNCDCE